TADGERGDLADQLADALDLLVVDAGDDVAAAHAGAQGGAGLAERVLNDHALAVAEPVDAGDLRRQLLQLDAQVAAPHPATGDQLVVDVDGGRRRQREADAAVGAGAGGDLRVDADDFACEVDQRAAAVARIDGRVGLQ